jgi:hypothetical protein
MGIRGRVLDDGELDGDDGIKDDGGEEDMGVEEREEGGCSINGLYSDFKLGSSE